MNQSEEAIQALEKLIEAAQNLKNGVTDGHINLTQVLNRVPRFTQSLEQLHTPKSPAGYEPQKLETREGKPDYRWAV